MKEREEWGKMGEKGGFEKESRFSHVRRSDLISPREIDLLSKKSISSQNQKMVVPTLTTPHVSVRSVYSNGLTSKRNSVNYGHGVSDSNQPHPSDLADFEVHTHNLSLFLFVIHFSTNFKSNKIKSNQIISHLLPISPTITY
jgi:hypothetical protein